MRENNSKKKYPLWFRLLIPFLEKRKYPEMPKNPSRNNWYRIYPEGCVGADGTPTHAQFYFGTENKLIVFFAVAVFPLMNIQQLDQQIILMAMHRICFIRLAWIW